MSVMLRGRKFHYRFLLKGEGYSGPCVNCVVQDPNDKRELEAVRKRALEYEAARKREAVEAVQATREAEADIRKNKTVRALVENYKYELTGGRPVSFAEAFALAAAKPSRRVATEAFRRTRETYWNDFSAFLADKFPDVRDLSSVRKCHCEAYVASLIATGRYVKEVAYSARGKRNRMREVSYRIDRGLSPKSIKEMAGACHWVFTKLFEDAGLIADPWRDVALPAKDPVDREVFTGEELELIWNGIQKDDFCRPLFLISANTGLTEGDICCLEWKSIDWGAEMLRTRRRKTGVKIVLPLFPQLLAFLQSLPRESEYVLPEHAALYLADSSRVSYRVKTFLNGLGIVTTREIPGRRAVSVKDLHSMRHVFCYRAKKAGVPESVIKKIVGHAVLAMTQHYADHDTDEDMHRELRKISPLFFDAPEKDDPRRRLAELAWSLPETEVRRLLEMVAPPAAPAVPVSARPLLVS